MDHDLRRRITVCADQCHGHPCVRGLRIRVVDVLQMLGGGMTNEEILAAYPYLESTDILACLAYAALELNHPVVAGTTAKG
jgi:uncharacterized protein (DUF433 family)